MPRTITLPDELVIKLQQEANNQRLSLDELALNILVNALEDEQIDYPTLEEVVAEIRATPPDPNNFEPATQSLAEQLAKLPDDPSFDVEAWNREWAKVEAEINAINHMDDLAEGRG